MKPCLRPDACVNKHQVTLVHQISSSRQLHEICFSIWCYFSPPKYNRMWFIIFKTYHPKVEGVRHIGDFVTFLIPVQTAFQGLSKWFYFTTLIVTTPYSGFNIGFSRLLLGYDKLSPICASILLICISFLSSSKPVIKCSDLPVLAGFLHVFTGLFIQFCQLNPWYKSISLMHLHSFFLVEYVTQK